MPLPYASASNPSHTPTVASSIHNIHTHVTTVTYTTRFHALTFSFILMGSLSLSPQNT